MGNSQNFYCDMSSPGYENVSEEFIESSENHFVEVEETIDEIVNTLAEVDETIDEIVNTIQDMANPVVFSAIKVEGDYTAGRYIIGFGEYLANNGNSFDLSTGTFVAPRAGVFEFSVAFLNANKNENRMSIEKNDNKELEFLAYTPGSSYDYDTLSFSWINELQQGDKIRLRVTAGHFFCSTTYVCIFNGKFIRQS